MTGPSFSLLGAQILFQYIGNFLSPSAKVGKTTIREWIRGSTENNYILGICSLEELDAERSGCWERPPQSEVATIPEVKAMEEEPCWEVRGWHKDRSSIQVALGYLRSGPCKQTCCLWVCFTLSSREWTLNPSGKAPELNPAAFTKSYCVTDHSPPLGWFSRWENPKISFLNDVCTLHKNENVKPFFKKPNHPYKNYLYKPKVSFSRECC